jgi:hypothetical protein
MDLKCYGGCFAKAPIFGAALDHSKQKQDEDDEKDEADAASAIVTPSRTDAIATITEQQNQDDQEEDKHFCSPFSAIVSPFVVRCRFCM